MFIELRRENYNLVKSIAIFMVCLYHFNTVDINVLSGIVSIPVFLNFFFFGILGTCVPFFFLVNGALLIEKPFDIDKYKQKLVSIIVLYFVWNITTLIFCNWYNNVPFQPITFVVDFLYRKVGANNHLWFLQALFVLYLFFPLIKRLDENGTKTERNIFLIGLVSFTFLSKFFISLFSSLLWLYDHSLVFKLDIFHGFTSFFGPISYSLGYFLVGSVLVERFGKIKIGNWFFVVVILFAMSVQFFLNITETLIQNRNIDPVFPSYGTLMTLVSTVALFLFLMRIEIESKAFKNVLDTIGSNTLGIYFVHRFVGIVLMPLFKKMQFAELLIVNIGFAAIIVLLSICIVLCAKKVPYVERFFRL